MHVIKLSALAQKRRWALFDFNASGTYYFDNVALSEIDLYVLPVQVLILLLVYVTEVIVVCKIFLMTN